MSATLSENDQRLVDAVSAFGCPSIVSLRNEQKQSPDHVPYLDLLSEQVQEEAGLLPDAVAEFQGRPVMYLIDAATGEPNFAERINLQQRLANRGDHAVLAIVRPGELILYPLNLDRKTLNEKGIGKTLRVADPRAPFLFHEIATGTLTDLEGQPKASDPVFEEIKTLLDEAVDELVIKKGLDGLAVLSMTGRALFFRFLVDRRIVTDELIKEICPAAKNDPKEYRLNRVFSTAERAAQTSTWLDVTFNGDLLPLIDPLPLDGSEARRNKAYSEVYKTAGDVSENRIFQHLEAILRGWEHVEGVQQPTLPGIDWHQLNFRHIPIGVLSQVYENFSHRVDKTDSTARSVHYTPRTLAKLLVDEALAGLETAAHQAKVLDPACGAGVFLVLALRELIRRRWDADKKRLGDGVRRPSKQIIEGILHNQIRGFDVSESALRLAALGLYITVIELNEITTPPSAHHASKALRNLVLFDQRTEEERHLVGFVNGSLGEAVDRKKFDGAFDVVVGNPPWSRLQGEDKRAAQRRLDATANQIACRVLASRGLSAQYTNPSGLPDLPFFWRAMEWVKPGGVIGYALHARLIFDQDNIGANARNTLFQALTVTGILNGSDLGKTPVWGCHDEPWLLIWARNEKPDWDKHSFHLLTPIREDELADRGGFRLDYQSAYQISANQIIQTGWLCKALAVGSTLDVSVMEKMTKAAARQSIGSFWKKYGLESTRGVDTSSFKNEPVYPWLCDLEVFDIQQEIWGTGVAFPVYRERHGERQPLSPRKLENFLPPLVMVRRAPRELRSAQKSFRGPDRTIAFSSNYYGFSAHSHPEAVLLTDLIHLLCHSQLFQHFAYMRSAELGAKKRILQKVDIEEFPFPDVSKLSVEQRKEVHRFAALLNIGGDKDWAALDAFVGELFGLTKTEQQVIADTVNFNGPYAIVRKQAMRPVPIEEATAFARTLEQAIQPFFKAVGQKVKATLMPRLQGDWRQPWAFVTLLLEGDSWKPSDKFIASLVGEASASSASRLVMPLPDGGLIVGLLNKRRFWTQSRARLCALHIAEEHLERCFPLPERK